MYTTGLEKSFAVVPLTWTVEPTLTEAPVVVKLATRAFTAVPVGTVTAMLVPLIEPVAEGEAKPKEVIAFADDDAGPIGFLQATAAMITSKNGKREKAFPFHDFLLAMFITKTLIYTTNFETIRKVNSEFLERRHLGITPHRHHQLSIRVFLGYNHDPEGRRR